MRTLQTLISANKLLKSVNCDAFSMTMKLIRKIRDSKPRPVCAKCGKVVDEFNLEEHDPNSLYFDFAAYCHGERQSFSVHKGVFIFADIVDIGQAFVDGAPQLIDFDSEAYGSSL